MPTRSSTAHSRPAHAYAVRHGVKLNANEIATLRALYASAEGNGFDFGYTDVAVNGLSAKQVSGYISSMVLKKVIELHREKRTGQGTLTQFFFHKGDQQRAGTQHDLAEEIKAAYLDAVPESAQSNAKIAKLLRIQNRAKALQDALDRLSLAWQPAFDAASSSPEWKAHRGEAPLRYDWSDVLA